MELMNFTNITVANDVLLTNESYRTGIFFHNFSAELTPVWISDLLLTDPKLKTSITDMLSNLTVWNGLLSSLSVLILHCTSLVINLFFFCLLAGRKRARKVMKLRVMLLSMTGLNMILNVTWLFCMLIDYLISMEDEGAILDDMDRSFGNFLWEIFGHQCIDSQQAIQSIFLLSLSLDRYLNLFADYSPYISSKCETLWIVIVPFILGASLFDYRPLTYLVPLSSAVFARLCALLVPHLLSFILLLVSSFRPAPSFEYEPRLSSSLAKSLPIVLFTIVVVDLFARIGIFFELLEINFKFVIVTGTETGDRSITILFDYWYKISHILLHAFPLYSTLSLLIFVRHYRQLTARCFSALCCRQKRAKMDYQTETLRSMMAEQRRQKMLASSIH